MTAPALPEVRQCADTTSTFYGAVAVAGGVDPVKCWGIMHPTNGGYWGTDEEVAGWKVMA